MVQEIVNRPEYLARLLAHRDKDLVKIITGIRRCGKSSLMMLFADSLREQGVPDSHIHHMNMESLRMHDYLDYLSFYQHVKGLLNTPGRHYLMVDEIQAVDQWERAVESFRLDFDVDIYITGSNAYLLSSQLSTLLSGRYVEIPLLPLSFREFLDFHRFPDKLSMEEKFQKYLQIGGMPVLRQFDFHLPGIFDALEGIYATVILRDVLQHNNISDQALLQKIVAFLSDNVGSINSPNSIGKVLASEGALEENGKTLSKASAAGRTVGKYIQMLEDAYIFYGVSRYDIKGKQLLKTLGKHYIVDIGFRNMLLGLRDADRGHVLENIVYLELLRRGYRIHIGKVGETEVDFVAETPQRKLYIQVAESMASAEVRERELRPLQQIPDHHEKRVLCMDRSFVTSYDGIRVDNLIDFLLDMV